MKELQRYSSEVDNLFTGGPKWLDFAIFSEQMVSTAINKNLEVLDKYNRHYNRKESLVHTHIILSTGWLWENGQVRPHDYTIGWELVQNLLIQKFSYYQLLFSQNAELEFCVDGFYYKECIPHFWCMINTRRNDVKNKRTTNAMEDRIIGTLMGQAVGDALGARYKFSTPNVALSPGNGGWRRPMRPKSSNARGWNRRAWPWCAAWAGARCRATTIRSPAAATCC